MIQPIWYITIHEYKKEPGTIGTSSGVIKCWDMRFQLPIVKCVHPNEARIRQLAITPHCPGSVLAAVQGTLKYRQERKYKGRYNCTCTLTTW